MEPVYFLPSEIARMVLGYLKRENCAKAYKALLKESSHLGEYSALLKQGREYPTTVAGKTLTEMLQEYGHIKLRETRTLKCGQPATALWKQFDELVKVIKQQVSPKQLQQPHSKQGRPRLSDRILCTGRSSDPLPEVVSTRISSDVEERRSASSSAEGFQSVASPVTTCPSLVCHTGTPASMTACSSVQTTAMCTGVQELVTRPTGTAVYSTPPKSCQKITYTSQLTVAKSHQSEVASDSTYLLSEDCGYPVCPGSCGFDQLQANTEDLSDSDTGAITKAPNSVQAGGSIFGENLEFNATEKTDNVPDSCTVKPQESSSEPQMAPSEAQREEVRMVMVEDETEKELQTPMSVCQPVSQCENAIDSFEQAKALNSPSVGGNQVSAAWHGMSRLSESAFSSIGHTSGIGATTPVKQTSLSEHVHVTPSKSCSFLTTNSTKGKSPRRKRFAPKRRSSGAAGIGGIVTSGLPGTGTGNVPRSVEGSGAHKLGHSEESLISHHEDSMDIPSLVEQLLENTELQKKLAENINKGRHLSCDPAEQKPEGQPQQRVPPVTPSKPPPTPRNTSMQSLEDILDIHEAQMSDVEMNGIIDMTRSDPAFDALFQLFDNGNEQDDKGAGDPTLSFSSQIRMALETDEDQQQIETDMATATLLQLSERPSTSNCETAHSNSRVESCQRVLDCGQFGDDGEPVQKQMGSGQEMDTEGAKGNGLSVNSDTKVCEQQSMSGCHANQASSSHVGVGIVENNFPAVSGSCESYEKVVEIVTTVQHEDASCNDQVHRAERRNTGQNTGDSKASVCTASTNHSPAGKSPGGARSVSQSVTTKTDLLSDIRPCSNRAWVDASRLEFHVTSESTSSPAQSYHSSVLGHSSNNDAPISSTRATKHPRKGKRPQNSAKVQIKTSCEPVVVVLAENSGGSNTVNDMDQGTKMSDYHKDTYRSSQVLTADGKANVMQKKNKVHSSTDGSNKSKIPSQEKVNVLNTSEYVPLGDNFAHDSSSDLDDGHRCKVSSDPMLSSTPKCSSHKLGLRKSDGCPGPASGAQGSPMSKSTSSFELAAESFAAGSEQNTSGSLATARKGDLTQSSSTVSPGKHDLHYASTIFLQAIRNLGAALLLDIL
ncbi:protein NPAT-like [Liolophura sinensis]|uniref:protein NPAT-like n=1 Tax=Liolophura sinensis TaxID=3198878 RepID=UPI0031592570